MHLKYQSLYNDDFEYSIKRLPRVYKKLFYLSHYVYVNFKPRKWVDTLKYMKGVSWYS